MRDIYHIVCKNDDAARELLQQIKTPAAEKYVAPSFHPNLPAVVVVIDPEDPTELLGLGIHFTTQVEEEIEETITDEQPTEEPR